ncbi:MAG: hypothetical protein IPM60_11430 [Rhodospirillales bacterium]|nr:hypothetical protein [Rhodospirillales bacterium]
MTEFATALDALFADPNIATDAVCTSVGGGALTIRVIARRPDEIIGFGDTRIHAATVGFEVRASEVPAPSVGDTIEIDGETFVVQGEPVKDRDGLFWTLDTRHA